MIFENDRTVSLQAFWDNMSTNNEAIGLINVRLSDISFVGHDPLPPIEHFLHDGIHMSPIKPDQGQDVWNTIVETYCKYVWLTREYLQNGKFTNYLGIHWNPVLNKFEIHPGISRQIIHYYFGPDPEVFIVFNTNGIEVDWLHKYDSVSKFKDAFPTASVIFTRDHNTIIPHIHFDTYTISSNVIDTHAILREFFLTTRIEANFDIEKLGYVPVTNPKKTIKVTIDPIDKDHIIKALMIMPTYEKFKGHGITIETTKS